MYVIVKVVPPQAPSTRPATGPCPSISRSRLSISGECWFLDSAWFRGCHGQGPLHLLPPRAHKGPQAKVLRPAFPPRQHDLEAEESARLQGNRGQVLARCLEGQNHRGASGLLSRVHAEVPEKNNHPRTRCSDDRSPLRKRTWPTRSTQRT